LKQALAGGKTYFITTTKLTATYSYIDKDAENRRIEGKIRPRLVVDGAADDDDDKAVASSAGEG